MPLYKKQHTLIRFIHEALCSFGSDESIQSAMKFKITQLEEAIFFNTSATKVVSGRQSNRRAVHGFLCFSLLNGDHSKIVFFSKKRIFYMLIYKPALFQYIFEAYQIRQMHAVAGSQKVVFSKGTDEKNLLYLCLLQLF